MLAAGAGEARLALAVTVHWVAGGLVVAEALQFHKFIDYLCIRCF